MKYNVGLWCSMNLRGHCSWHLIRLLSGFIVGENRNNTVDSTISLRTHSIVVRCFIDSEASQWRVNPGQRHHINSGNSTEPNTEAKLKFQHNTFVLNA